MKKILLFITALFICFNIMANERCNDHFYIKYKDGSIIYYYAEYSPTEFNLHGWRGNFWIDDASYCDDSKKKSRKDYDRIVDEINSTHSGVITAYNKYPLGQIIKFDGTITDIDR